VAGVFLVRRREGPRAAPIPGGARTAVLYVTATLLFAGLSVQRQPGEAAACAATVVTGLAAYRIFRRGGG
jgi:hypothetical protein